MNRAKKTIFDIATEIFGEMRNTTVEENILFDDMLERKSTVIGTIIDIDSDSHDCSKDDSFSDDCD